MKRRIYYNASIYSIKEFSHILLYTHFNCSAYIAN